MIALSLLVVVVGLVVGSFLNVVIYRLPRGESLWTPPSHCPKCKSPIKWLDNIPILSFFLLHGRCRSCHQPISWRYPLVEGISALFFFLTFRYHCAGYSEFFNFPFFLSLFKNLLFISLLIPAFFIDLEYQIIPDSLSYTLLISGVIFAFLQGFIFPSLLGIALGIALFLAIFYLSLLFLHQAGIGIGDIKIAAGLGAYFGWKMALLTFFLSFLVGALVASSLLLLHLRGMRDRIPFGPFLVTGAFLTSFFGKKLIQLYLSLLW